MRKLIAIVKESLVAGEDTDYTSIGVRRAIVLLSIPMVLEMAMESVFALVDIFFVSKLGKHAIATVGLTESVLTLVYSLAWGLGMGITAVVARRTGERDPQGAARAAMQGVLAAIALGVVIAIPGLLYAREILALMGAEADVLVEGPRYMRIMLGGNVIILLLFGINAIYRGAGDAAMAMRSLMIANGMNILLCPLLIHGLGTWGGFGIMGAAMATTLGRGIGVCYQFYHLFDGRGRITLKGIPMLLDKGVMVNIIKVSAGGMIQFLLPSVSWIFLSRIVAVFGSGAVAGYTIAVRIMIFSLLPSWGVANAASTLVGQNLGAKQPDRAARSAWYCGHINMLYMVCVAILFWSFAPWLVAFFTTEGAVAGYAISALRILCMGYFFYGYGMVFAQAFNGAGDTMTPTWMNAICFLLVQIPLAWFLAEFLQWGPTGAFSAVPLSESLLAVLSAVLFQRGKWKEVKV
ncbi:MAG TPA: MATE family efflux transporter [Flavobacteriales bacterium]|nr:MATE family efflux transporter [Flavobacteriales bacterium]